MSLTREDQIRELFKFPIDYQIKHLYKYRSMETENHMSRIERIFSKHEIYFASPISFNDPFECRPRLTVYNKGAMRREYVKDIAHKRFSHLNRKERRKQIRFGDKKLRSDPTIIIKAHDAFLKVTGLYCLSSVNDDILMWSHYADGHRGVCLEFDASKEINLFRQALEVNYDMSYPLLNIMNVDDPIEYHKAVLTKSKHWEYEKEWRIIKDQNEGGVGIRNFQPESLTGVIFGASISSEHKKVISGWISNYPTKIITYQARISKTNYELEIKPI